MKFNLLSSRNFSVQGEIKDGQLFLHCSEIRNWSKSVYIECLEALDTIKEAAKEQGLTHVFVAIPDNDEKLYRFESMMGFEEYGSKDGVILMGQPVGR